MTDRIAVLTGVFGFLGTKIFTILRSQGFSVIGIDVVESESHLGGIKSELIDYFKLDLSNINKVLEFCSEFKEKYGVPDVVINNASMRLFRKFEEFTPVELIKGFNTNLISPILLMNYFLPMMNAQRRGLIINIGSISAFDGYQTGSMYCSSKMGLVRVSESINRELGSRSCVKVVTINPDSFATQEGEINNKGEEIVQKILKLIIDASSSKFKTENTLVANFSKKFKFTSYQIKKLFRFVFGI